MSDFTVHNIAGSPFGRAVMATLEEKGASYRFAPVPPTSLKVEPHIQRHPFGRVPVLEHGDFRLYETQAILRYLDRALPEPALTPADPKALARMDQVMNVCDWYLFQGAGSVIAFQRIIGPKIFGTTPDVAAIEAVMDKTVQVCAELEQTLGANPYFAGDALSLADLMVAPHIDLLSQTPEWAVLSAGTPNLAAWHGRMAARPSLMATTWSRADEMARAA